MNNAISLTNFVLAVQFHVHLYRILKKRPKIHWTYTTGRFRRFLGEAGLKIKRSYGIGLIQPEAELYIFTGASLPLIPESFGRWFMESVEERFKLGEGYLRNFMKVVVFVVGKNW